MTELQYFRDKTHLPIGQQLVHAPCTRVFPSMHTIIITLNARLPVQNWWWCAVVERRVSLGACMCALSQFMTRTHIYIRMCTHTQTATLVTHSVHIGIYRESNETWKHTSSTPVCVMHCLKGESLVSSVHLYFKHVRGGSVCDVYILTSMFRCPRQNCWHGLWWNK